jgi:hypothetical protein
MITFEEIVLYVLYFTVGYAAYQIINSRYL